MIFISQAYLSFLKYLFLSSHNIFILLGLGKILKDFCNSFFSQGTHYHI